MKYKNLMAKALYDNVPESPEELAFRKGDILTVIEQNTGGLEGWWLCSLHGRQGIAPGNRLKLLIGPAFEAQPSGGGAAPQQTSGDGAAQGIYQVPSSLQSPQQSPYQVPPGQDVYQVPPRSHLAADSPASKVVTPTRVGQSYTFSPGQLSQQDLYDVPPIRAQQGVYDVPPAQTGSAQTSSGRNRGVYDLPPPPGVYSVPPSRTNAALQEGNYDVPQPLRPQQEGIYDVPPPLTSAGPPSLYDVPPPLTSAGPPSLYDAPPPLTSAGPPSLYDAPPPLTSAGPPSLYDFPPSPEPLPRHANANEGIYDVPPPALHSGAGPQTDVYDVPRPAQDAGAAAEVAEGVNRLSFSSTASSRSSMSTSSSSAGSEGRLPLDADAALQRLQRLQQAVELSIGVLHTMAASPRWRTLPFMERHANDVRGVLDRLRAALGDLVAFGRGAAANAAALPDPGLHAKLRRQLARLEDSQQILLQIHQALEGCGWAPHALASSGRSQHKSHDLDRLLMVSRSVPDDAKQLASAVGGSAELLFRRAAQEENLRRPLGSPSSDSRRAQKKKLQSSSSPDKDSEKCVKSWMEDYDYVHLQGKDDFERQQKELLDKENIMKQSQSQLGQEQIKQFRKLEQEVIKPVENDITQWVSLQRASSPADSSSSSSSTSASVCARDRQLLAFYSEQCQQHFVTLLSAVDAFFGCVGAGQPPRIFVAHSKFVILSAHKLVFIGDTLSRQAAAPEVANRVMNCSNVLCDLLKTVVAATKTAALNYPNTAAVQEMVDRVTELSHHAQHFKEQLLQMAAL